MSTLSCLAIIYRLIDSSSIFSHFFQGAIWLVFAVYTIGFVHVAHPGRSWWKHHVADLIITITWNPIFLSYTLGTQNLLPVILQLIGLMAHGLCASRDLRFRWGKHPLIASSVGLIGVMCLGSALLHRLEPETFKSFWSGVWFSFETVTTLGFGELVPHTMFGQIVTGVICLAGSGLLSILSAYLAVNIQASVHWNPSRRFNRTTTEPENSEILRELKALRIQVETLNLKVEQLNSDQNPKK